MRTTVLSHGDFTFVIPDEDDIMKDDVLRAHISASRALAELNGALSAIPNSRILIDALPLKEAGSSCLIENIVASQDDIYKSLSASDGAPGMGAREIIGCMRAISYAEGSVPSIDL